MTKLTARQVLEIWKLRGKPDIYGVDIAKQYGVSATTISRIWTGKRRINVTEGK